MNSPTPLFSRINRVVFVIAIACFAPTLCAVIFVAAHSDKTPAASSSTDTRDKTRIAERFGELPLSFEINTGQTDPAVKFLSHGPGYDLFLTANEAVLTLRKPQAAGEKIVEGTVLRLKMMGANVKARVEGQEELPGKVNYFIGNDRDKWCRNVPTYRKVRYTNVYPGIDIVYYGNQQELEYDFVVAPGADPKLIKFRVEGPKRIRLDQQGSLLLTLKHGEVRLNKPFIYQFNKEGVRSEVKGSYVINGKEIRFNVRNVDSRKPLVIDPVLSYSTYLGGTGNDQAFGIAVDAQGSAYVTGRTDSVEFPTTPGAFKTSELGGAFVTKLDPTGSTLIYSTFLDGNVLIGSAFTVATAIAVDSSGNAHITGLTTDSDFPVVNPLKTSKTFFKTTDSALTWTNNSTGLAEELNTLAVAPTNPNIIYAGDFRGAYRSTDAGTTWTKSSTGLSEFTSINTIAVNPTNSSIAYAGALGLFKTVDGGNNWSAVNIPNISASVRTIVFDPVTPSTMYVGSNAGVFRSTDSGTTWTALNNFPVPSIPDVASLAINPTAPSTIYAGTWGSGLFKTTNGGSNWIAINNGITSSFGTNPAVVDDIVIDPLSSSTLYINVASSRINKSTNGGDSWAPVNNSAVAGGINALVVTPSAVYAGTVGGGVIKSTDGGSSWTRVNTGLWSGIIRVLVSDPSNAAVLYTGGSAVFSSTDAFVSKLNSSGSELLFSTYLGGSLDDAGTGIAVDGSGNIYVSGNTKSANFPILNALQSTPSATESGGNAFVAKLNPATPSYVFSTYLGGSAKDEANGIAIDPAANVYVTGNTLSQDFPVANAFQATLGDLFAGDAFVTKLNSNGTLSYSTYLGGSSTDNGFGIAVDVAGNAYVAGVTRSMNFPVANPIQTANDLSTGASDAFVTKLNSNGSALVYSTFLGGANVDAARGIAVDATGNAYVTGSTGSQNFPLVAGAVRTRSSVFKSVNAAANWSNDNYGLTAPVTQLAIHPTQPFTLYAATETGLFRSTDGGKNWSAINNGLTARFITGLVIDPLTPATLYVAALDGSSNISGVYKSTDGGNSWNLRSNGIFNTNLRSLAIDPVTPTTLYAGAFNGPIFKTTDGADNWAASGTPPPFNPLSLAVDPHTPTRIFATELGNGGGVFRSLDSAATWQSVLTQASADGRWVGVSPLTPGLVFAMLNQVGFFKSVNGGDNWTFVRGGNGKVVFDPVSASTLYLLSDLEGLLKSTDNGQTWMPMNNGLAGKNVVDLAVNPLRTSTLYVAAVSIREGDAFVTKINPSGSAFIYSTLIGGTQNPIDSLDVNDQAFAIAVDSAGNAYITGFARSPDFPTTPNAFQAVNLGGFADTFITKLTMSYIISGHVLEGGGAPVNGAEVVLSDGVSLTSVVTEADGAYEFSHLREGGSFAVSAAKPHFTMTPPSQSFNNLNADQVLNFTATVSNATFHTIGGQVTENGIGLAGVTVTLSGSQAGIRTTDSNGNYSFELPAGNYTVTPSATGFTFGPPSQTFNNLNAAQTANFTATRQSFVVTNADNHGTGSLREAIANANAHAGADTITFNIPGPGVKVIDLLTPLPEITDPVVIDASTQPGYAGAPLVELNGQNAGFENGLVITAGNSTVRGLAIGGFARSAIVLRSGGNNVIQGNYIGIDATGNQERPNFSSGIFISDSSNNVIGGTSAAARNVISDNLNGVEIFGSGNVVQGNFIGTNAAGTAALGNRANGIVIPVHTNNLIGGDSAGAGNLISGNTIGISTSAPGITIQGNLIGTDFTGTKAIPNAFGVAGSGPNTLIGGLTPAARNVISGNSNGVEIGGAGSKLQGNFIGTDITGTVALGNTFEGVFADDGALIGGTVPGARNVIAANQHANISLGFSSSSEGVTIQGNYIGTDVTGSRAILSFTNGSGIEISSTNNLIGGLVSEAQNVISGNAVGIKFRSANVGSPQGNNVRGNLIGLNAAGTGPVPNTQGGIQFSEGSNNFIGGTQSGAANKIAFNGKHGVMVFERALQNSIRGNSIFSNDGLGIDLSDSGVTANDATDADTGANNLQNFPVLTSVTSAANSTTIQGSLTSTPNTTFQIDFYSSLALDPSGHGEGAQFFNTTSVTTNGNGAATINVTFPVSLPTGRVITATATDSNGNTSEFSAGDVTSAGGSAQFSVESIQLIEDLGLLTVTVLRKGGSAGNLTVDYATMDGTATAGQDYTATSGALTFSSGEMTKSFQIPITDDAVTEPNETFKVTLSAASLETLGAPTTLVVTIQDRSTVPFISQNSALVTEGNTGTTTDAFFTFTLSAATGRSVSVNYATSNLTATGGAACGNPGIDYETTSGVISFQPGNTAVTIAVKVCGDTSGEAAEGFLVNLSSPVNATLDDTQALGVIGDDDVLELLFEENGPTAEHAAALDALLLVRDPFRVELPEWFLPSESDRNMKVMFFVRGLQLDPGEPPGAVIINFFASNNVLFGVPARDVRSLPGVDFAQVIVRLPDGLAAGNCNVSIVAHSRTTNVGRITIAP